MSDELDLGGWTLLGVGSTAEVYLAPDGDRVVKLVRPGFERFVTEVEWRGTRAAVEAGAPAPAVRGVVRVGERSGLVLDRVCGRPLLDLVTARPWLAGRAGRQLARAQVAIHQRPGTGLPEVRQLLREGIDRGDWSRTEAGRLHAWIDALPTGDRLCHRDLHPGNLLLGVGGATVIDWADAAQGHPAADVARTAVILAHSGESVAERLVGRWLGAAHLREYRRLTGLSRAQVQLWRVPVAAARLQEGIGPGEAARLRSLVRTALTPSNAARRSPAGSDR